MNRWFLKISIILISMLVSALSYAELSIHIVEGMDKPYPIAVVPFNDAQISTVIGDDLAMSGQFQVVQDPDDSIGPEFVVKGAVNGSTVSYRLVSTLSHKPLLSRTFNNIQPKQMRSLAHYISDQIYQTITGVRGVFSTRLAYVEVINQFSPRPTYRLMVSDIDGQRAQMLLQLMNTPIASLAWSPDGREIAYTSYLRNRMTVYAINVATGQRRIISSFPGINSAADWSPSGNSMVLALSKGAGAQTNLYLMNLSTQKLTQLTRVATNTSPHFSPDGKAIVYTSDRSGNPQIYQMDLASKQSKRLTFEGVQNFSAAYTPDGKNIVYMDQAERRGPIQLVAMNLASGRVWQLTNGQLDKSPSIAPNGQMIVYANYDHSNGILAETSLNGKIHLQLPAAQGSVQSPAWSPFLTR